MREYGMCAMPKSFAFTKCVNALFKRSMAFLFQQPRSAGVVAEGTFPRKASWKGNNVQSKLAGIDMKVNKIYFMTEYLY